MRTTLLALTTAVAVGALAAPMAASAASQHGMGGSIGGGGGAAPTVGGSTAATHAPQNFSTGGKVGNWNGPSGKTWNGSGKTWNGPGKTWSGKNWKGQNWAWDGHRHHRHHRNFAVVPFVGFDDYTYADSCWDYTWTPAGYQRVYICGGPGYAYYDDGY
jgi:hypothetical protein